MKKKQMFITLLIMFSLLGLVFSAGLSAQTSETLIIGSWRDGDGDIWKFAENKEVTVYGRVWNYDIRENMLLLYNADADPADANNTILFRFSFTQDGKTMTLRPAQGGSMTLRRVS